jgi:hypothetical protein
MKNNANDNADDLVDQLFEQALTKDPILKDPFYHQHLRKVFGRQYHSIMKTFEIKEVRLPYEAD